MRAAYICAVALCVGLMVGQQAESHDIASSVSGFEEAVRADEVVAPFEDVEEGLYQEEAGAELAQAFQGCGFQGQARDVGTPMVVNGHSNICSLKVPSGQCASLFDKAGYNEGTEGYMLAIRGPMNVPNLADIKLHENGPNWMEVTNSYKMGPCTAKPSEEMATAAIKSAANTVPDLQSLSNAAKHAAEGSFGSIVQSLTKSDKDDGVAHAYDSHRVMGKIAQLMGVGGSSTTPAATPVVKTNEVKPYPYAEHKVVQQLDKIEHKPAPGSGAGKPSDARPASGSALFRWEHAHLGNKAWKKFSIPFPKLPSATPFKDGNSPVDDAEDLIKNAKKDDMGCDPMLGCRPPPPPCVDNDPQQICADYVAHGDCQFDFVERDCRKSCQLCPGPKGSTSNDAYTGPEGHYYLGSARRRIGAGFGRRRRSPTPAPTGKKTITSPKPSHKKTVKVPVSILHPNGKKTVIVKGKKGISCKKCVNDFEAAGGCDVWKKGGDATNLVPKGCMVCGKEAAKHCGVPMNEPEHNAVPKPIEHPHTAGKIIAKAAAKEAHSVSKGLVPPAIRAAIHKVLKAAGALPKASGHTLGKALAKVSSSTKGTGSGASPKAVKKAEKKIKAVTMAAAVVAAAQAAATGHAAAGATGSAAHAEASVVKAKAALIKAIVAGTGISAAKAKVVAAKAVAAVQEAAAAHAQTVADKAAAVSAKTQVAAAKAAHPGKIIPPISAMPPTPEEHREKEAASWAQTQLKKAEGSASSMMEMPF